jgi:hypothetical protein
MSGWSEDSATGGRARSVISLRSATDSAATPAATLAESAQVGANRRRVASLTAPTAAMRGHLTHHADATTKRAVSGSQRRPCVASIARLSSSVR